MRQFIPLVGLLLAATASAQAQPGCLQTSVRLPGVYFSKLQGRADHEFLRNPQGLANIVYAGRLGNGNEASGDGWRFRGGGHIQNTGRDGYRVTGKAIGVDLEAHPELIEDPDIAALAAAAYWTRLSNADKLARAGNIWGTRAAVNGPKMLHLAEMLAYYDQALAALKAQTSPYGTVLLVPQGGGEPVRWDGSSLYNGQDLRVLVPQLRVAYPNPGGLWEYGGLLKVWMRRNGDMVLERL